MDLKNLVTFIHVAELNSFTKAGQRLGFSQSTVSFQIRQLEEELGTQLFERINHTVALTERGREALKYAHQITKLTQELGEAAKNKTKAAGKVRLATADSLCDSLLSKDFDRFRKRYPEISLEIITAGTEEMFRLLNQNQVDAVLTLDKHIYHTEYVIAREERVSVHFVAPPNHPFCGKKKTELRELARQPFILTEKGMSYRRIMDEKLAGISLEIQPVLETGSAELICSLVSQGAGLSFLPDYVTEKAQKEGKVCYLDTEEFDADVWKQLIYHRDKWISPQMESVLSYCSEREFSQKNSEA